MSPAGLSVFCPNKLEVSPAALAPPNKELPPDGGGPAGVVEKVGGVALLAAGVVVPVSFAAPNSVLEEGCEVLLAPPKKTELVGPGV